MMQYLEIQSSDLERWSIVESTVARNVIGW